MCRVIEEMRKEECAEGRTKDLLENILALMKNLSVSAEKAMELLGVPADGHKNILEKLPVA